MLFGGPVDDARDGFGHMVVRCEAKLVEGGEEVVVTRFRSVAPVAHGPRVDDLVVENMVVVGATDGGLGRVVLAIIAGRGEQAGSGPIDAVVVGGGKVDQIFRVQSAVEMGVEVSSFWHVVHER